MWIRKKDDELVRDQLMARRRLVRNTVVYWIALSTACSVFRGHNGYRRPPLWTRTLYDWIFTILASLLVGGLVVYFTYWRPRSDPDRPPETVVCPRCGKVKKPDGTEVCDCGGTFVDLLQMKWVEHGHEASTRRSSGG